MKNGTRQLFGSNELGCETLLFDATRVLVDGLSNGAPPPTGCE
jgi:hypothetical protein